MTHPAYAGLYPAPAIPGKTGGNGSPFDPAAIERDRAANAALSEATSPLQPLFPEPLIERAYFHQITVPSGLSATAGNGPAWYLLRQITAGGSIRPFQLSAVSWVMHPPDVDGVGVSGQVAAGTAAGNALPWGDTTGTSAAIVVLRNPNMPVGTWTFAPAQIPGIELASATGTYGAPNSATLINPANGAEPYLHAQPFPGGKWSSNPPAQSIGRRMFLPASPRFRSGERLGLALVIGRSFVHSLAANRVLCGRAEVSLELLPLDGTRPLQ